ncbi:hypothetical protein HDV05_004020 [Chytridiales sp. JEL 0842]|nr:hypothetical protein HDV05_004020 [Chytridiales sp. JEL 0842]
MLNPPPATLRRRFMDEGSVNTLPASAPLKSPSFQVASASNQYNALSNAVTVTPGSTSWPLPQSNGAGIPGAPDQDQPLHQLTLLPGSKPITKETPGLLVDFRNGCPNTTAIPTIPSTIPVIAYVSASAGSLAECNLLDKISLLTQPAVSSSLAMVIFAPDSQASLNSFLALPVSPLTQTLPMLALDPASASKLSNELSGYGFASMNVTWTNYAAFGKPFPGLQLLVFPASLAGSFGNAGRAPATSSKVAISAAVWVITSVLGLVVIFSGILWWWSYKRRQNATKESQFGAAGGFYKQTNMERIPSQEYQNQHRRRSNASMLINSNRPSVDKPHPFTTTPPSTIIRSVTPTFDASVGLPNPPKTPPPTFPPNASSYPPSSMSRTYGQLPPSHLNFPGPNPPPQLPPSSTHQFSSSYGSSSAASSSSSSSNGTYLSHPQIPHGVYSRSPSPMLAYRPGLNAVGGLKANGLAPVQTKSLENESNGGKAGDRTSQMMTPWTITPTVW